MIDGLADQLQEQRRNDHYSENGVKRPGLEAIQRALNAKFNQQLTKDQVNSAVALVRQSKNLGYVNSQYGLQNFKKAYAIFHSEAQSWIWMGRRTPDRRCDG